MDIANNAGIHHSQLDLYESITNTDISNSAAITYSKLDLSNSIQSGDFAPGAISISSDDISDGSITYNKLSLTDNVIPYTKLNLTYQITAMDIANNAGIHHSQLDLYESISNTDISNSAAITYSKLDLSNSIQSGDFAPGAISISSDDISDGSVTYNKLSLADNEIPYTKLDLSYQITGMDIANNANIVYSKLDLYESITDTDISNSAGITYSKLNLTHSIDSTDIKDSSLNLYDLTTGTFNATNSYLTNTTIWGQANIYDLNVSENADIVGTLSADILAVNQHISYSGAGYESRLIFASPSTSQSITIPDVSGKLVAVSTDGNNGQALITDGSGGYSWQTIPGVSGGLTETDIQDGAVTYAKINLADNDIPYTKLNLSNAIDSSDIRNSSLNLANLSSTSVDINGGSIDDTTIGASTPSTAIFTSLTTSSVDINGGAIDGTTIGATSQAEAKFTTITVINGISFSSGALDSMATQSATAVDIDGGEIDGTTIGAITPSTGYFSTVNANSVNINGGEIDGTTIGANTSATATFTILTATSVDINGGAIDGTAIGANTPSTGLFTSLTVTNGIAANISADILAVNQHISYSEAGYESQLIFASPSTNQSITIPDMSGKLVAVSYDGQNGQSLVADGAGGYSWQTITGSGGPITTTGIYDGAVTYPKLNLADYSIPYTKLILGDAIDSNDIKNNSLNLSHLATNTFYADTLFITDTTIYGVADVYSDLNVSGNATISGMLSSDTLTINQHISYTEAGNESKLIFDAPSAMNAITIPDMSGKLVVISEDGLNGQSLVADGSGGYSWTTIPGAGSGITETDIHDGAVTYAKMNLADGEIPYSKIDLYNAIDSSAIKDSSLYLYDLTASGTLSAYSLNVTDTTTIGGKTTIHNHLSVTGTTYANALSVTDIAIINGATTINDNLAVTGTTIIDGQTDIHNDVNVSGNALITGTVTSSALALSQYILFTDGLFENKIVLESLSGWNSLTIPDMTGKLVAVQSDGTNGQALVADGLGSYTWQTLETSSDVNYTSVTASRADFDNLTVNNDFVLYNSENPAGQILMSTSAALPQQITIPDISGNVVITEKQGANGQAIVSDGLGGYTWQTLNTGLTHEITVGDGGDYSTITDALNSITDNSASNQYVIKIGPGTYVEQVNMKEYVDIYGSGKNATIIVSSGSSADPISGDTSSATVIGANYASIRNLSIQSNSSADYAIGICNYYVSPTIEDINIYASSSDPNSHAIGIYQYSGSTAISSVEISSVSSGTIHGIYFNNVTEKTIVKQLLIRISGGNYSSGILNENNSKTNIQYVNIIVSSAANGHTGIRNSHSRPTINHVAINLLDDSGNNTDNYAILNENSDPIINNTTGNVFVLTTGPNYGLFNYDSSEPELNNVTLNVKNGATNTKIFNEDSASRIILNATTYTGSLTVDSAELTQITIKSNAYLLTSMTFQGYSSTDGIETIIKVEEPTQVNTIRFPDASGTVMLSGGSGGTLDVSSVTANAGTYTEMTVSNQISVSKTTVSGDMLLADEYSAITGNTTPADTAFYFGDKDTDGAWRMVRIGTSLVMQRRESGLWVSKMSVNP
jgi:hypothetical protein